jgi:hypothetical protein
MFSSRPRQNKFNVRPDNMLTLRSAEQITNEKDFEETLQSVRDRVDEIEGLHRQSEICVKEPFQIRYESGGWLSWLWPNRGRVISVEGLGAAFVPAKDEKDD